MKTWDLFIPGVLIMAAGLLLVWATRDRPRHHVPAPLPPEAAAWVEDLRGMAQHIAVTPVEDDPALRQDAPLRDEPLGPSLPQWWEIPPPAEETAPLFEARPLPALGFAPRELDIDHVWNRGDAAPATREMEESR